VIGRRQLPTRWDEDVLLRCFSEEFDRVIPIAALAEEPITPQGEWDLAAYKLIRDLARTRLLDPDSSEMQRLLVEYMTAKLAIALGDRSPSALERGKAAATAATAKWPALDAAAYQAKEKPARPG
jgi:hypothetical protein